jgi:hypothetical protein
MTSNAPGLQQPAKPKYFAGEWSHIFKGEARERNTRIVLDVGSQTLVRLQVQRNRSIADSFSAASLDEIADLLDSLINSNGELFEDPEDYGLEGVDQLPVWAFNHFPPGQVVFYHPDPGAHGPITIRAIPSKVEGFSTYKDMPLMFDPADLCTAAALGNELIELIFAKGKPMYRAEKIIARVAALKRAAELASN